MQFFASEIAMTATFSFTGPGVRLFLLLLFGFGLQGQPALARYLKRPEQEAVLQRRRRPVLRVFAYILYYADSILRDTQICDSQSSHTHQQFLPSQPNPTCSFGQVPRLPTTEAPSQHHHNFRSAQNIFTLRGMYVSIDVCCFDL